MKYKCGPLWNVLCPDSSPFVCLSVCLFVYLSTLPFGITFEPLEIEALYLEWILNLWCLFKWHQGNDLVTLTLTFVLKIVFFFRLCCRREGHIVSQTHLDFCRSYASWNLFWPVGDLYCFSNTFKMLVKICLPLGPYSSYMDSGEKRTPLRPCHTTQLVSCDLVSWN